MAGETQGPRVSLAVWDIPPTVVAGERFTIKAGAKSSAACDLRGRRIEACDASGAVIASGELGVAPWPGTEALYWTELSLPAPAQCGMTAMSVHFHGAGLAPAHRDASSRFTTVAVPAPEHTVTIELVEQETGSAIADAEIRFGAHRATTKASGRAELRLAKGDYDLRIWKVGYDAPPRPVAVAGDALVEVRAAIVPEENADRAWKG